MAVMRNFLSRFSEEKSKTPLHNLRETQNVGEEWKKRGKGDLE